MPVGRKRGTRSTEQPCDLRDDPDGVPNTTLDENERRWIWWTHRRRRPERDPSRSPPTFRTLDEEQLPIAANAIIVPVKQTEEPQGNHNHHECGGRGAWLGRLLQQVGGKIVEPNQNNTVTTTRTLCFLRAQRQSTAHRAKKCNSRGPGCGGAHPNLAKHRRIHNVWSRLRRSPTSRLGIVTRVLRRPALHARPRRRSWNLACSRATRSDGWRTDSRMRGSLAVTSSRHSRSGSVSPGMEYARLDQGSIEEIRSVFRGLDTQFDLAIEDRRAGNAGCAILVAEVPSRPARRCSSISWLVRAVTRRSA